MDIRERKREGLTIGGEGERGGRGQGGGGVCSVLMEGWRRRVDVTKGIVLLSSFPPRRCFLIIVHKDLSRSEKRKKKKKQRNVLWSWMFTFDILRWLTNIDLICSTMKLLKRGKFWNPPLAVFKSRESSNPYPQTLSHSSPSPLPSFLSYLLQRPRMQTLTSRGV